MKPPYKCSHIYNCTIGIPSKDRTALVVGYVADPLPYNQVELCKYLKENLVTNTIINFTVTQIAGYGYRFAGKADWTGEPVQPTLVGYSVWFGGQPAFLSDVNGTAVFSDGTFSVDYPSPGGAANIGNGLCYVKDPSGTTVSNNTAFTILQ